MGGRKSVLIFSRSETGTAPLSPRPPLNILAIWVLSYPRTRSSETKPRPLSRFEIGCQQARLTKIARNTLPPLRSMVQPCSSSACSVQSVSLSVKIKSMGRRNRATSPKRLKRTMRCWVHLKRLSPGILNSSW